MDQEIVIAIISASAVIIAAIIAAIAQRRKSEKNNTNITGNKNIIGDGNIVNITEEKTDAIIHIVDTEFIVNEEGYFIDIKLRNSGDKIAFIKNIEFIIYDMFTMKNPQITHYRLIPPTATYDVILSDNQRQSFQISQAIEANGVDRFRIKVASSIAETRMATIYYFSFVLNYNENNQTVESEKYISAFPSTSEWTGCYVSDFVKEIAKSNYLELLRISKYNCKKSQVFINIYNSYEDNKKDFI